MKQLTAYADWQIRDDPLFSKLATSTSAYQGDRRITLLSYGR